MPGNPGQNQPGRCVALPGAIKELKLDGVVSIELEYSLESSKIVQWMEEACRETAKLMESAGLRG